MNKKDIEFWIKTHKEHLKELEDNYEENLNFIKYTEGDLTECKCANNEIKAEIEITKKHIEELKKDWIKATE